MDTTCALAWVHANADAHSLDPSRVVVLGASAGGFLAAAMGTADDLTTRVADCPHALPEDPIAGAVVMYGFFDFQNIEEVPPASVASFEAFWGARYEELSPEQVAELSPIVAIDGSEPPFLIVHGTEDQLAPVAPAERFAAELKNAGVTAELFLPTAGHGFVDFQPFDVPDVAEALAVIESFIAGIS